MGQTITSKSFLTSNIDAGVLPVIDLTEALDANKGKKITISQIRAYFQANFFSKVFSGLLTKTANQYGFSTNGYTAHDKNNIFNLKPQATNTSDNPTLKINSLGAKNLMIFDQNLLNPNYRNVKDGEFEAFRFYQICYEPNFDAYLILNHEVPVQIFTDDLTVENLSSTALTYTFPERRMPFSGSIQQAIATGDVNTVEYSINGGSFATNIPFQVTEGDLVEFRVTFNSAQTKGGVHIKGTTKL